MSLHRNATLSLKKIVGMLLCILALCRCTCSGNEDSQSAPGQCKCVPPNAQTELLDIRAIQNEFGKIVSEYGTPRQFCTGGKIRLNKSFSKLVYWRRDEACSSPETVDLLSCSEEALESMVACSSPSPFGRGPQTIYDESVRRAREFKAEEIAMQFVPTFNGELCVKIRKLLDGRDFFLKPHKLAIYEEGGHFAKHKDTVRGDGMVASLVVCLPFPFEGGVLSVADKHGIKIDFDWGRPCDQNTMSWACFFCDVDHEVSTVTRGRRLTLTYDVYLAKCSPGNGEEKIRLEIEESFSALARRELASFLQKLDGNKRYAYHPAHDYSFGTTGSWEEEGSGKDLESVLKGADLQLFRVLRESGWDAKLLVLYPDIDLYGPNIDFDVEEYVDSTIDMMDAIRSCDKERLRRVEELFTINSEQQDVSEIYEYSYYYGFAGNEAFKDQDSYYARTVLVFSRLPVSLNALRYQQEALESLVISGCDVSPGTISAHFRSLSKHLKELDVHWNYNLSDTDWRAVGEMEELKSLNMSDCFMVPERISTHLRGLRTHLERLNTSCNANMSSAYWETVGDMAALKSLNMHNCDVATETISAHFRSLKKHLEVLVVSGNKRLGDKDWETIGEMSALRSLDVSFCDMRPSAIGVHIRKLRGGLTSLRVSGNKALSDTDWKTIGKMSALRKLDVSFCEMRPGTIHRHFQELREHLKVLAVSGNKELSYADWETIGKMSVLRKLYVSDCYIQPGTISAQLQGLRKRLEELDVSRNKELSYTDWETIGEMSALRKLDVSECEIEPGTIHRHFQELKSHLVRLYVHDNRKLSDRDWKTVGEMTHLESLWIVGCGVRAGKISKHLRGLRSFQVVE